GAVGLGPPARVCWALRRPILSLRRAASSLRCSTGYGARLLCSLLVSAVSLRSRPPRRAHHTLVGALTLVAAPSFALDFDRPLLELDRKIDELKSLSATADFTAEIQKLEKKARRLQSEIFSDLSRWQVTQLSRHPQRPYFLDCVQLLFTDFFELAGDRSYGEDPSIVGGWARLDGRPVMLLGHQKGRNPNENLLPTFGI